MTEHQKLEQQLNSFESKERREALERLVAMNVEVPQQTGNVNMHFHSFFSYNAEGWSPSRIAWESYKNGIMAAALCDFDVLDGQEEFLEAGELLGLRCAVHLETRAFLYEYADVDINSPGEPGVKYIMGAGFARPLPEGSPQAETLAAYRKKARQRNISLIERINPHVENIAIDYEGDVIALTPSGTATERHIISAYVNKAIEVYTDRKALAAFWASLFDRSEEEVEVLLDNRAKLEEVVRSKLAKRGGPGYVQPSEETFPSVDDFINWVLSCGAIPMITWLDGTSKGEANPKAFLECLRDKGAVALNIIPDRNCNISDPEVRKTKRDNLRRMVEAANTLDIPINIGTEMNRLGLPFADDLSGEALAPYKKTFQRGARILTGHSILLRYANYSYIGKQAQCEFAENTKAKNDFFASVGGLPPLTGKTAALLRDMDVDKALSCIRDCAKSGQWHC